MRRPVDLDHVNRAVGRGDEPVTGPTGHEPARVFVDPLEVGIERGGVADGDAEAVRTDAGDHHLVCRAPQLQVDRATHPVLDLGPSAAGGREQAGDLDLLLLLVGLDAGRDQRDPGVLVGDEPALAADPVDPPGVGRAVDDLGLGEQVEDEALVRRSPLDDDRRLGDGPAQAAEGLAPVAAVGDDLGDHRVEVGGDGVALTDSGVDPDAGPGRQVEQHDPARGRREVAVRVLGVEPRLEGVPPLGRSRALETAATGDVDLGLDEVQVGRDLGDRVLDLEAGVDLEEGEDLLARVVEELHRPRAGVVDGEGEPLGARLELAGLLGRQDGRRGLLDDLLVAALHRAVADAQGPGRALPVGDDLHLDVARPGDETLEEDDAAAEGALGLVAGAGIRVGQLLVGADDPDAAAAPAGCRLEHEGVADRVAHGDGVLEGVDRSPTPWGDGHADLLGEELRADLVPELAHRVGARPDEGHTDALTQLRESGVLGDESPADPGRVGPGLAQRPLEDGVVEVGPGRGRAEVVGQVGLADEHGPPLTLGVEGHDLDVGAVLGVEVSDRVDETHRRLATVDDCDPGETHR